MQHVLYFDIASIIILSVLFYSLIVRKMVTGRTNRLILHIVLLIIVTSFVDILRFLLLEKNIVSGNSLWVLNILNYLYFVLRSIIAPSYILYIYSSCEIFEYYKLNKRRFILFGSLLIPSVAILIADIFHPGLLWYYDENMNYVRGYGLIVLWFNILAYYILGICSIIKFRKVIPRDKRISVIMLFPINIVAVVIQMIFPSLLVENISLSFAILFIVCVIQRPEDLYDVNLNFYNMQSFRNDLKAKFDINMEFNIIFCKIINYTHLQKQLGYLRYRDVIRNCRVIIGDMMKEYDVQPFYLEMGLIGILSYTESIPRMKEAADKMFEIVSKPQTSEEMEVSLNCGIVVIECPKDINNYESLMNFANSYYNSMDLKHGPALLSSVSDSKDFQIRNEINDIISRGIKNNSFEMYYQPIYNTKEKCFTSAEALIRLKDEKYGFISPAIFIPAAEETGAIHQIGDFVLEEVCKFISSVDFNQLGLKYIEINLSVAQCIEINLYEKIILTLRKYGVKISQINLEITETAADYNVEISDKNILKLSNAGVKFSLDDYGTGYSNIKRICSMPLNIIKMDKSFVDEMNDPKMAIIINNTIKMLKRIDKTVLVEGVEDEQAAKVFEELGCEYIQGYYFSKPLDVNNFVQFIKEKNRVDA